MIHYLSPELFGAWIGQMLIDKLSNPPPASHPLRCMDLEQLEFLAEVVAVARSYIASREPRALPLLKRFENDVDHERRRLTAPRRTWRTCSRSTCSPRPRLA